MDWETVVGNGVFDGGGWSGNLEVRSLASFSAKAVGTERGVSSYEHHSIDEPAILLGGGFVVKEKVIEKLVKK